MEIKQYEDTVPFPDAEPPIDVHSSEHRQALELGQGLSLSSDEKLCALMEAMRLSVEEIAAQTGWPVSWIWTIRGKPEYHIMIERCIHMVAERIVCDAEDIDELFDSQVRPSTQALIEVRDNPFTKAGDRIKAATEFLNRAQAAPKAKQITEDRRIIVNLPLSELKNMQKALQEHGEPEDIEVFELLEGEGFNNVTNDG